MAKSTYYRYLQADSKSRVDMIKERINKPNGIHLHWVDNYARFIARSAIHIDRELFRKCYWTAHAVKVVCV